jgi:hypothetical protein
MYDLLKRTIQRNVGSEITLATPELKELEKLVAAILKHWLLRWNLLFGFLIQ